jgi:hypothetical protein
MNSVDNSAFFNNGGKKGSKVVKSGKIYLFLAKPNNDGAYRGI